MAFNLVHWTCISAATVRLRTLIRLQTYMRSVVEVMGGFNPTVPSVYRPVQTSHGRGINQSEERPAGAAARVDRLTLL